MALDLAMERACKAWWDSPNYPAVPSLDEAFAAGWRAASSLWDSRTLYQVVGMDLHGHEIVEQISCAHCLNTEATVDAPA